MTSLNNIYCMYFVSICILLCISVVIFEFAGHFGYCINCNDYKSETFMMPYKPFILYGGFHGFFARNCFMQMFNKIFLNQIAAILDSSLTTVCFMTGNNRLSRAPCTHSIVSSSAKRSAFGLRVTVLGDDQYKQMPRFTVGLAR